MDHNIRPLKLGSLRYQDESGEWHIAEPGSLMFSTVSMVATEYLTAEGWTAIFPEDCDAESS